MTFNTYGDKENQSLLLIPGLGVSYEIFMPLIELLKDQFYIVAVGIDGFLLGQESQFTSVDDQAVQAAQYVRENLNGHLDVAYGLSLGGKILSRIMERNEIVIDHAIMDAAPLLPLPKWSVNPIRYYQSLNVWTCYHCTGFWKFVFHSHYFDVLLDECKKVWPYGRERLCETATKMSILINWNPFTGQIYIIGMAPRRLSWPSRRPSTCSNYVLMPMWRSSQK